MGVFDDAVLLWDPGEDGGRSREIVLGMESDTALSEGTYVEVGGIPGRSYSGSTGARFDNIDSAGVSIDPTVDHSIMVRILRDVNGTQWNSLLASGQSQRYSALGVDSNQWRGQVRGRSSGWALSGEAHGATTVATLVMVFDAALSGCDVFADGVLADDTVVAGNANLSAAYNRLTIGRLDRASSPANSAGQTVFAAAVWDRKLSSDEVTEVNADPRAYLFPTRRFLSSRTLSSSTISQVGFRG